MIYLNLNSQFKYLALAASASVLAAPGLIAAGSPPRVPRFSIDYMDKAVAPGADFFHYADGGWVKNNPVPPDKSRWAAFVELQERNWFLIHDILDSTTTGMVQANSPVQ